MKNALVILGLVVSSVIGQTWQDYTSALVNRVGSSSPYNSGAVVTNRLTGDVFVNIIGSGIFQSTDAGVTWSTTRVDQGAVTNRCENGWGSIVDQDDPRRMAFFALDGESGFTADGVTWHPMNKLGRGWDFGSVDWSVADPQVVCVVDHEINPGRVFLSTDRGNSWTQLNIQVNSMTKPETAMFTVLNTTTFIYCDGAGIFRSSNQGSTWTKVSDVNSSSKMAEKFKGKFYLGTANGLLVSADTGKTWQQVGQSIKIYQGPFFGATEDIMMLFNSQGCYKSVNGGSSWAKVADLSTGGASNDPSWFADYCWDPVNNVIYYARMASHGYKYALPSESFTFTGGTATPSPVINSSTTQVQFSIGVIPTQGTIASVAINLSALGGNSAVAMQNTTGSTYTASYTVPAGAIAGEKTLTVTATNNLGATARLDIILEIADANQPVLVSKNKPTVASSSQGSTTAASYAVDGDMTSRWGSIASDPQWIYVDLGSAMPVSKVVLYWESAYGRSYSIQVSDNASTWTDAFTTTTGNGSTDEINFAPASGRYVRMYGTARGTSWGYSLYEFEIYSPPTTSIIPKAQAGQSLKKPAALKITFRGTILNGNGDNLFDIRGKRIAKTSFSRQAIIIKKDK